MTQVYENRVTQQSFSGVQSSCFTTERLGKIVESAHLNFLIGAGTSSPYIPTLGNVEDILEELENATAQENIKKLVRASIQAYFFEKVLAPNTKIIEHDKTAEDVFQSYLSLVRTLNRILLLRRNTLLSKQVNIFTTNVDMLFEVAMEALGINYSDGFNGKILPKFDFGDFGTLRFRTSSRYEHRFEVPVFNLVKIHGSAAWRQDKRENGLIDIYFDHDLTLVKKIEKLLGQPNTEFLSVTADSQSGQEGSTLHTVDELIAKAKKYFKNRDLRETRGQKRLPPDVERFSDIYKELGIVNPDKRKFATTVLNETYYELIRRLANELEKENSVLFVHGFSFRDEHIRDIILRAASTNPTLQVIVFCYSYKDRKSFKQHLPDVDIKNDNIKFIIPDEPRENKKERKITLDVLVSDYLTPIVSEKISDLDSRIENDIHALREKEVPDD